MQDTATLHCRACGSGTTSILDLGTSPLANQLMVSPDAAPKTYPLGLVQCSTCGLVQNMTNLPTDVLFDADYPYLSSVSASVQANAQDLARQIVQHKGSDITALDVGSNDGATQVAFREQGVACFGVDPAPIAVAQAVAKGCAAHCGPFDASACDVVRDTIGDVDVITMSNVLAHVPDPGALLRLAYDLMPKTGVLVLEVQSWLDLVKVGGFDMVYHEHHTHFSLTSLMTLVQQHGFGVFRADTTQAQGGSLRVWCNKAQDHTPHMLDRAQREAAALADAPAQLRATTQACIESAQAFMTATAGRRVVGYGAAAKTVTLLAACGSDLGLSEIIDGAPSKIAKFLPLHDLPIVAPDTLTTDPPDVVLLFAWNLADEILPKLSGCEVWSPMPTFRRLQ